MERVVQYLDEFDDLIGAIRLIAERLRSLALFILTMLMFTALLAGGILLAITEPPLALAAVTVLMVTLMYRFVTNPPQHQTTA